MTQDQLNRYHALASAKGHTEAEGKEYQELASLYRLHEPHKGYTGYRVDFNPNDMIPEGVAAPVKPEGRGMWTLLYGRAAKKSSMAGCYS